MPSHGELTSDSQSRSIDTVVAWIQRIYLPRRFVRCCPRLFKKNNPDGKNSNNDDNDKEHSVHDIPLISGVDHVVNGSLPASESIKICGIRPPRYLFYMLSGGLCDVLQLALDLFVHRVLVVEDPSLCWAIGFALSIVARHTSHRYLVFGKYVGGYWSSLGRMYAGYSIIIFLSTSFNFIMTRIAGVPHYMAWAITLLWTGVVNYFILKRLWSFGGQNNKENKKAKAEGAKQQVFIKRKERDLEHGADVRNHLGELKDSTANRRSLKDDAEIHARFS
uniref:GtrA-like protein domain-containing protein n=1 Tax=Trieres chinensis TaxID=1514140 RepID=A0A7S2A9H1_TRICV|mmetsp:Transcript_8283/g.17543  ORF Transcript_8283/g.17543 Transcript_8283/m.17543 type:complete len:277 (+) Transcript_8283:100-930(+)|eukprot:CAMPEP_0183326900 /NCGR_PEP_ID=MMETSP0160_2-20130417/83422_1 /TAXON_ID=2839 ORGANISM="Odontella Sinensis, Strain Grunow 1884" /NCGR_SAMPLE_ID=MMETSP0160_2 /ASSEMBLY_ACC=CAM_ASM_000250 /LENGTH=276 /DNA_ID=CAMNT_0025494995 /DNA_START=62 /DNA_END=892 /DNA_ORIENTATION=-